MQKISTELLADITKETIDFVPNYDGAEIEPSILPTRVPNLLLNGTLGIAVGMATNIPPHNLTEILSALKYLAEKPEARIDELLEFVKGPDFPLGGIIFNKDDIAHAYKTGRGGVVTRGNAEIEELPGGGERIVITSIPFRVNKSVLVEKIASLFRDKKLIGLKDLRDESAKDIRIVIDLKRGSFAQKILNTLYKNTQLEEKFNFNIVAIVNGAPKTLNLKDILEEFLVHRRSVVKRAVQYDLKKAEARAHILEGLKKALDHIDEVIAIIKKSKSVEEAKTNLIKKFKFSDIQAQAILDMRLQKLAGLERKKIEDELKELLKLIKELKEILSSSKRITKIIIEQFDEIIEKYGDPRRTTVVPTPAGSFNPEDLIPEEESTLVLTENGYIKRTNPSEFKSQKRGGVGVVDMNTKDEDVISEMITASTHADILFFSTKGKVYNVKMYEIPEGKRATRGKFISNFLPLDENEKITSVLSMTKETKEIAESLIMVTKNGIIKKTEASAFFGIRANGLIAISLKDNDELIDARFISDKDDIILSTHDGQAIRFKHSDVRPMGRTAGGVRGIKLKKKDDYVVSMAISNHDIKNQELLIISENGYGKKTKVSEYKVQNRGGSGVKSMNVTDKTGKIVGVSIINKDEHTEMIAMSSNSQVIRTSLKDIPTLKRDTQGVRVMRLRDGDKVASFRRF